MAGSDPQDKFSLHPRIINSLYPIAVRNNVALPKCFKQYKLFSNSPSWEDTLTIKDKRSQSSKALAISKILADQPIPLCCSLYYYEVKVSSKRQCGCVAVGFTIEDSAKPKNHDNDYTIGYHSNTGRIFHAEDVDEDELQGPPFEEGDVVGCGVNFVRNSVFFTRNGIIVANAHVRIKLNTCVTPSVLLVSPTTTLTGNFGQREFVFSILQHSAQERCAAVNQAIETRLTPDLANVKMQSLVFDYLLRQGFLTTAKAMSTTTSASEATTVVSSSSTGQGVVGSVVNPDSLPMSSLAITAPCESAGAAPSTPMTPDVEAPASAGATRPNGFQKLSSSVESPMTEADEPFTPFTEVPPTPPLPLVPPIPGHSGNPSSESGVVAASTSTVEAGWHYGGDEIWPETHSAASQRIRLAELIHDGHYLEAIAQLTKDYDGLVQSMPSIVFMLHCRYFIELLFTNQKPVNTPNSSSPSHCSPQKASSAPPMNSGAEPLPRKPQKRSQPDNTEAQSPRQPAAVRRKCEEEEGGGDNMEGGLDGLNGASLVEQAMESDDGNVGPADDKEEAVFHRNGHVAVLSPAACARNGISSLKKEKRRVTRSLSKSASPTIVATNGFTDKSVKSQNGFAHPSPSEAARPQPQPASQSAAGTPLDQASTVDAKPTPAAVQSDGCSSTLDLSGVVKLGRELRQKAQELQARKVLTPGQMTLLQEAFSLVAYENPYESPFADLMHPRHRKLLAESVNNAILVNLGKARYPLLETSIGMLEETVSGNRGRGRNPGSPKSSDAKSRRKAHNATSTSSTGGSTLTPSHSLHPLHQHHANPVRIITASTSSPHRHTSTSTSTTTQHRGHHHRRSHVHQQTSTSHRSVMSSLVVSSTSTRARAAEHVQAVPYPLFSSGRRLRNTVVQSSPHEGDVLQVVTTGTVTAGGGGVSGTDEEWEGPQRAEAEEDEEEEEAELLMVQTPPPPPPRPPHSGGSMDIHAGGSEMAGFFHPALFIPTQP